MTYLEKLNALNAHRCEGKWAERICAELSYLDGLSKLRGGIYDGRVEEGCDAVLTAVERDGVITRDTVLRTEELLSDMEEAAKSLTQLYVSHAHIDMNWMWGYHETASLTVDTFRTILNLMREYPEFTYAQSQASTYEIIAKFCPEMLDEIRARVAEGRWEVTAAEWVEPDKNMPDGESLSRQILQSKKYLSALLSLPADALCIDFVPDTFGHNANVPQILVDGGIKYMYHCRGYEGPCLYRFTAPSGKSVLCYREFEWYNGEISTHKFEILPLFCEQEHVNIGLCVYGVGDHGGGPSRRDIERLLEYRTWPLTPEMRFGTFREFFAAISEDESAFPEANFELNCLFTGCYTSQSRIKMANRISEARMNEAEALSAMASSLAHAPRAQCRLDAAWRRILFNHFHDILPGSGTVDTREYAMGSFQETVAAVTTHVNRAMRAIADAIDTSNIPFDDAQETRSEGGGAGFQLSYADRYRLTSAERGRGRVRAVHLFNPCGYDRHELAEITVWDYQYGMDGVTVTDASGQVLPSCVTADGFGFWGHAYHKLLVDVSVPALGYTTLILQKQAPVGHLSQVATSYEKSDEFISDAPVIMQNDLIRVVFDRATMQITSMEDLETGKQLVDRPSAFFRLIDEDPCYGMTSWRVGPYSKITNLNETCQVHASNFHMGSLLSSVYYELSFGSSVLRTVISLKKGSRVLEYDVNVEWNELPERGRRVPQLSFALPVSYATDGKCYYDIPYGTVVRAPLAHDVPALSYLGIGGADARSLGIITDTKYGYRCYDSVGSVTLIRSSYEPDPLPEAGVHHIRIGVAVAAMDEMRTLSHRFNHPLPCIAATGHTGTLPAVGSAMTLSGEAVLSCVKCAEDGEGTVIRLFSERETDGSVTLTFPGIKEAFLTDTNENIRSALTVSDGRVEIPMPAKAVTTVMVRE